MRTRDRPATHGTGPASIRKPAPPRWHCRSSPSHVTTGRGVTGQHRESSAVAHMLCGLNLVVRHSAPLEGRPRIAGGPVLTREGADACSDSAGVAAAGARLDRLVLRGREGPPQCIPRHCGSPRWLHRRPRLCKRRRPARSQLAPANGRAISASHTTWTRQRFGSQEMLGSEVSG